MKAVLWLLGAMATTLVILAVLFIADQTEEGEPSIPPANQEWEIIEKPPVVIIDPTAKKEVAP